MNQIKVTFEPTTNYSQAESVSNSVDAASIARSFWSKGQIALVEEFKVLFLNNANKVLGVFELSKGGITGTVADVRILFAAALQSAATGIILCHNHPSGNLNPSSSDQKLTEKFIKAGRILDIAVLDHIILSPFDEEYTSLSDMGYM